MHGNAIIRIKCCSIRCLTHLCCIACCAPSHELPLLRFFKEFSRFGAILSSKVVKRPDGSSKGYGFVCFNDTSAAFTSVEGMNGRAYGGKRLKVSLKKTPEECLHLQVQKLMEISNANQPYDRDRDCTLFVFHLPSSWDDKDMYQVRLILQLWR